MYGMGLIKLRQVSFRSPLPTADQAERPGWKKPHTVELASEPGLEPVSPTSQDGAHRHGPLGQAPTPRQPSDPAGTGPARPAAASHAFRGAELRPEHGGQFTPASTRQDTDAGVDAPKAPSPSAGKGANMRGPQESPARATGQAYNLGCGSQGGRSEAGGGSSSTSRFASVASLKERMWLKDTVPPAWLLNRRFGALPVTASLLPFCPHSV